MSVVKITVRSYLKLSHPFYPLNGDRQSQFEKKFKCQVVGGGQTVHDDIQLRFDSEQDAVFFMLRYI